MNVIKDIRFIQKALTEDQITKLETGASKFKRFSNIEFKILSFKDNVLTVEARQGKSHAENYADQKTLIARTKELFGIFLPDVTIHVRATPYSIPPVDQVTPEWIQQRMLESGVKIRDLVAITGIDKTNLSVWINGSRGMSQAVKAMFYFYFTRP